MGNGLLSGQSIYNCSSAHLLDTGNFVVNDVIGAVKWESFDHPSDTLLPSMLMGYDRGSGKMNFVTSWKSENDPSAGLSTQALIWNNGSTVWRNGPWDTAIFIGMRVKSSLGQNPFFIVDNQTQGGTYLSYSFEKIPGDSFLSVNKNRMVAYMDLSSEGRLGFFLAESAKNWTRTWISSENPCNDYCEAYKETSSSHVPRCPRALCSDSLEPCAGFPRVL